MYCLTKNQDLFFHNYKYMHVSCDVEEQISFDDYLWNVDIKKVEKENKEPMSENMMPIAEAKVGTISWQSQIEYLVKYTNGVVEKYDNLVFTDVSALKKYGLK